METKINSNLDSEKNKKGVNLTSGEAAASAAGIAGVAGAAAAGIATGSFKAVENPGGGTSGGGTSGGGTSGGGASSGGIASNQNEDLNTDNQNGEQELVDPTDVPFTDSDVEIVVPEGGSSEQLAEVDVNEVVDEILGIEEVDPTDTDVLADVVELEDVGVFYTVDGEEILANQVAIDDVTTPDGDVYLDDGNIVDGGEIALVDDVTGDDAIDSTYGQETDNSDVNIDTMDFSDNFVG